MSGPEPQPGQYWQGRGKNQAYCQITHTDELYVFYQLLRTRAGNEPRHCYGGRVLRMYLHRFWMLAPDQKPM